MRRYIVDVDRKGWASALPGLTAALRDVGAAATAGRLLAASWGWLDADIRLWLGYPSPATRRKPLAELGKPLAGLLAAVDTARWCSARTRRTSTSRQAAAST